MTANTRSEHRAHRSCVNALPYDRFVDCKTFRQYGDTLSIAEFFAVHICGPHRPTFVEIVSAIAWKKRCARRRIAERTPALASDVSRMIGSADERASNTRRIMPHGLSTMHTVTST